MGLCHSEQKLDLFKTFPQYKGAGILFAEDPWVLAGVQKHYSQATVLSGLGGRREQTDPDWCHTAWREVVEELFHVDHVPAPLIQELRISIPLRSSPTYSHGYVLARLTFDDLTQTLRICKKHRVQTNLYTPFPQTIGDLVLARHPSPTAEIGALVLLPSNPSLTVAPEFKEDLASLSPLKIDEPLPSLV